MQNLQSTAQQETQPTQPLHIKRNTAHVFSVADIDNIKTFAKSKCQAKVALGMSLTSLGFTGTLLEREEMGIAAEMMMHKLLKLPEPCEQDFVNNMSYDFKYNGLTIDVKSSQNLFPTMYVSTDKYDSGKLPDIYVMIRQVNIAKYIFIGSATKHSLFKKLDTRNIERYAIESYMLKDLII